MKNKVIIFIISILITVLIYSYNYNTNENNKTEGFIEPINNIVSRGAITINDINYFNKFSNKNMSTLINNNKLVVPETKKNKFLFVTFDNRKSKYIDIHNENIKKYANKWGYEYKFINTCKYNVYWCKIQIVLDELTNGSYDYVVWLDSDSAIKKHGIDINDIVNKYKSDIFVASDNLRSYDFINAGVFIIKNTITGKQFLQDCINNVKRECFNQDGTLKGIWAASCYEQGQLNLHIADKYSKYTTVLPNDVILNFSSCNDNTFIMHLYGSSNNAREECLSKIKV